MYTHMIYNSTSNQNLQHFQAQRATEAQRFQAVQKTVMMGLQANLQTVWAAWARGWRSVADHGLWIGYNKCNIHVYMYIYIYM